MYKSILLSEDEMKQLDSEPWYGVGDDVNLGGYIEKNEDGELMGTLNLQVNGETFDNWIEFVKLPAEIAKRLIAEG
jgi:hypothetical protein